MKCSNFRDVHCRALTATDVRFEACEAFITNIIGSLFCALLTWDGFCPSPKRSLCIEILCLEDYAKAAGIVDEQYGMCLAFMKSVNPGIAEIASYSWNMFRLEYISRPPALHSFALLLFVALKAFSICVTYQNRIPKAQRNSIHRTSIEDLLD